MHLFEMAKLLPASSGSMLPGSGAATHERLTWTSTVGSRMTPSDGHLLAVTTYQLGGSAGPHGTQGFLMDIFCRECSAKAVLSLMLTQGRAAPGNPVRTRIGFFGMSRTPLSAHSGARA